jgi:hypothetical protein
MDLTSLGIDIALIAAIVAAAKVITTVFDPKATLERWYPLLPLILAIPVSMVKYWGAGVLQIVLNTFIYGALAAYAYKTGKTTILGQ